MRIIPADLQTELTDAEIDELFSDENYQRALEELDAAREALAEQRDAMYQRHAATCC
jgi:hypothetical protein